jgi:parallel beta-helix repeat protein
MLRHASTRGVRVGILIAIACVPFAAAAGGGRPSPPQQSNRPRSYYVSPSGSDAGLGTRGAPYRTIKHASRVLRPGDTLYVRRGTYAEALLDRIRGGSSWAAPVTVKAYPGETVILRPPPGSSHVLLFSSSASRYIIVSGLTLDAANVRSDAVKITDNWNGSTGTAAHHIRLRDCVIKNVRENPAAHMGVLITANPSAGLSCDSNELLNCKIHDIGGSEGPGDLQHGVYIQSNHNLVDRCEIYRCSAYGLQIYRASPTLRDGRTCSNNVVRNCKVHDNNIGRDSQSLGILVGMGKNNLVCNNLVYNNGGGIRVNYGASDTKVLNNTVYNNRSRSTGYGIDVESSFAPPFGTVVKNNILCDNRCAFRDRGKGTAEDYNLASDTSISGGHGLRSADPLFVNAAAGDFHLRAGSPAIDAGAKLDSVRTDHDGVRRPQGVAYDMGAYEHTRP